MKLILLSLFVMQLAYGNSWQAVRELAQSEQGHLYSEFSLVVADKKSTHITLGSPQKIFDLASLTKVVVTATSIMKLIEFDKLSLSTTLNTFFPEFSGKDKETVTIEDLLRHRSGLHSGQAPLANEKLSDYLIRAATRPLHYSPRTKMVYSDLNAIFLGTIVEKITKVSLEEFGQTFIFTPLKMLDTSFHPSFRGDETCAPVIRGRNCFVHDPTAQHFSPHSLGHAGLFSTASDLSHFAFMMLNHGEYNGVRVLSEESVRLMTEVVSGESRGLGWDLTSAYARAPRGEYFSLDQSYGHTGYTGTTIWIDQSTESFYLFLSNRPFMGDNRTRSLFTDFRFQLSTLIGQEIYKGQP
jgi:CubicO group peptidase (beta-lactamase class C family)